jgi:hypothetical protein
MGRVGLDFGVSAAWKWLGDIVPQNPHPEGANQKGRK